MSWVIPGFLRHVRAVSAVVKRSYLHLSLAFFLSNWMRHVYNDESGSSRHVGVEDKVEGCSHEVRIQEVEQKRYRCGTGTMWVGSRPWSL